MSQHQIAAAADRGASTSRTQAAVHESGVLDARQDAYLTRSVALYGPRRPVRPSRTLAARATRLGQVPPKSTLTQIGDAPDGFGKVVAWDPADEALALLVYLGAGDALGVMISGVQRTDTIEFVSAAGVASFAEETENKHAGAFITLVAAGTSATATAFGVPELAPVIAAADKYAKAQFEEKKVKTKRRDAFGVDPGTGHRARQEGGVLVCLPGARQTFYSGNDDHRDRWIKSPGFPRDNAHRPAHVRSAFFLQNGSANHHEADTDGDIIITPWDHDFADNFGYYRCHVLLKRGSGALPPEVE